ncbi:MAG TPA: CHAT domain-containing protein [Pyrinomonadaceae bacterium]
MVLAWLEVCPAAQAFGSLETNRLFSSFALSNTPSDWSTYLQDGASLLTREPVRKDIKGGETKLFRFSLTAGQFAQLLIEQQGIILHATLTNLANGQMAKMDSPSDSYGPIYLSVIAKESSDYALEIHSTEAWANPGSFEVSIRELRDVSLADQERVLAERSFAEGRNLIARQDEISRRAGLGKFKDSLEKWKVLGDVHWMALTEYALGSAHRRLGEPSLDYFQETLKLRAGLNEEDWRLVASALNDLGVTAADLGDQYETLARQSIDSALEMFQQHHDRRGEASALNNIGYLYFKKGRYHEAVTYWKQALPLRRAENDQLREFNLINNIGAAHDALGEPDEAVADCAQTLTIWRSLYHQGLLLDPDRLAAALNNTAAAYERTDQWQKAFDSYEEALAISQKSGNAQRQASTLTNLGRFYQQWGDFVRARSYYTDALKLVRDKVKDPKFEANLLTQLGGIFVSDGRFKEAQTNFELSSQINQLPAREAELLNYRALIALRDGNPTAARDFYIKARNGLMNSKERDRRAEAAISANLAQAYELLGQHSTALQEFNMALALWTDLKDTRGQALALQGIATVKRNTNDLDEALRLNSRAIQTVESLRTGVTSYQLRASYFANQQNYYQLNVELTMMLYQKTRDPQYLTRAIEASEESRARSLLDTLSESHFNITLAADQELLQQKQRLEKKIETKSEARTQLLSKTPNVEELRTLDNELTALIDDANYVRNLINVKNPKYAAFNQPHILSTSEIQKQLDPDTLLLEFFLGEKRSYVWVVTPNSIEAVDLRPRDEIENAAKRLTNSIAEFKREVPNETSAQWNKRRALAEKEFDAASTQLSEMVVRPVLPLIGTKRLVVVADGALQRVLFGALPLPGASARQPRRLIEDHEIVYEPSVSVLALQRSELAGRKHASHSIAIFANPVFASNDSRVARANRPNPQLNTQQPKSNSTSSSESATRSRDLSRALEDTGLDQFTVLSSSADEATRIVELAPKGQTKVATDFDANRETAMSKDLADYQIIHFATHAVVNYEHPELSGIVLSLVDRSGQPRDGYLRLYDIYNLNLPADLVVLSACQTGVGKEIKGEGLIALTRGFMYAGAERVVASLWKVNDVATAELMAQFYKQIFVNGQRPSAALRAAQLWLAKKRSPVDWAGFVLQGEWK